jgi:hypothetical protein
MAFPSWLLPGGGGAPPTLINVTFTPSSPLVFAAIVLRSDLDIPGEGGDPSGAAAGDWARLTALGADALLATHTAAWAALWDSGGIELAGNRSVAAAANSSLYAILSALRSDVNFSTCPGGLSTNSYSGHTFWDLETWMFPPLLLLHPDLADLTVRTIDHHDEGLAAPAHAQSSRLMSQGWLTWIRTRKIPNNRIRTQRLPGVPFPCQQTVPIGSQVQVVTGYKHEIIEHCLPHLQLRRNARIVRGERIVRVNRVEACMQSAAYLLALCALL